MKSHKATSKSGTDSGKSSTRKIPIRTRTKAKNPQRGVSKTAAQRLETAYQSLGVDPGEVAAAPNITLILKEVFKRGIAEAVEHLSASAHPEAREFIKEWRTHPPLQKKLPFEAFCLACSIPPLRILELLVSTCYENADTAVKILTAVSHPKIVKATIKNALKPEGAIDRKMLHLNKGFLPVPKNTVNFFRPGASQHNQLDQSQHLHLEGNPAIEANKVSYDPNAVHDIEVRLNRITDRFNSRLGQLAEVAGAGLEPVEEAEVIEQAVEPTSDRLQPPVDDLQSDEGEWG